MSAQPQSSIAFMVANEGVEQVELTRPWEAVAGTGAVPVLIAPKAEQVQAFNHLDKGDSFTATVATSDARVDDFAALVLPGGVANPDQLRMDDAAVRFIQSFANSSKPIAVICHGPWTLVEADVVRGRRLTSWPSLQTDLRNAGAEWVDEQVVVCSNGAGPLISSRKPDDLDAFCSTLLDCLREQR